MLLRDVMLAQVYKAKNRVTNGIVALKKIRVHSENFGVREGLRSLCRLLLVER